MACMYFSHGENGLSSSDGASSLITFSTRDDLVTYMYAFYDSMKLDTNLQFDFLPINVKKSEEKQSYKDQIGSHMEAYFKEIKLRQAKKTQSNVSSICKYVSKKNSRAKKRKPRYRPEYNKMFKKSKRSKSVLAKECTAKNMARQNPTFQAKEITLSGHG